MLEFSKLLLSFEDIPTYSGLFDKFVYGA